MPQTSPMNWMLLSLMGLFLITSIHSSLKTTQMKKTFTKMVKISSKTYQW